MIRLEIHGDDFSEYANISEEQYKDISWVAITTEESYHYVHVLMEGIKNYFDFLEKENDRRRERD